MAVLALRERSGVPLDGLTVSAIQLHGNEH
jgi:hypothetical protein